MKLTLNESGGDPQNHQINEARRQEIIDELVKNHQRLVGTLIRRGVNEHVAEDIAQETFIKAQNAVDKFRNESSLFNWQSIIAWNIYMDKMRKKENRTDLHYEFDENHLKNSINSHPDLSGSKSNAREQLEAKEEKEQMYVSIQKLSPNDRDIINLALNEKTYKEISAIYNIPIGTVMSRLHYARKKLSEILNKDSQNQ